ncbi:hypothetical protein PRIPAC_97371, partial [Pristionchus pacificus]|uniref:Translocon-associated protein subunit gamma n=1 Tax=Pristionchus pacificus TaxID=54126 RepID=A0A2A6D177_PRIPA
MSKTTKFSKEHEALLGSYSNNVSPRGSQAIFYLNALISTAAPVYLFLGINHMDRAQAVTREIDKKYVDKKISTKEKEERHNEVAEEESGYLSVFITKSPFSSFLPSSSSTTSTPYVSLSFNTYLVSF